jgi:hypothetical protein
VVLHPSLNGLVSCGAISRGRFLRVSMVRSLPLALRSTSVPVIMAVTAPPLRPRQVPFSSLPVISNIVDLALVLEKHPFAGKRLRTLVGTRNLPVSVDSDDDFSSLSRFVAQAALMTRGMGTRFALYGFGMQQSESLDERAATAASNACGEAAVFESSLARYTLEEKEWLSNTLMVAIRHACTVWVTAAVEEVLAAGAGEHTQETLRAELQEHIGSPKDSFGSDLATSFHSTLMSRISFVLDHTESFESLAEAREEAGEQISKALDHIMDLVARVHLRSQAVYRRDGAAWSLMLGYAGRRCDSPALARSPKRPREPEMDDLEPEDEYWEEEIVPIAQAIATASSRVKPASHAVKPLVVGRLTKVQRVHSFATTQRDQGWPVVFSFELQDESGVVGVSCWGPAAAGAWGVLRDAPLGSLIAVRVERIKNRKASSTFTLAEVAARGPVEAPLAEISLNQWSSLDTPARLPEHPPSRSVPVLRVREVAHRAGDGAESFLHTTEQGSADSNTRAINDQLFRLYEEGLMEAMTKVASANPTDVAKVVVLQLREHFSASDARRAALASIANRIQQSHWAVDVAKRFFAVIQGAMAEQDAASKRHLITQRFPPIPLQFDFFDGLQGSNDGDVVAIHGLVTHVGPVVSSSASDADFLQRCCMAHHPDDLFGWGSDDRLSKELLSKPVAAKPSSRKGKSTRPKLEDADFHRVLESCDTMARQSVAKVLAECVDGRAELLLPAARLAAAASSAATKGGGATASEADLPTDGPWRQYRWVTIADPKGLAVLVRLDCNGHDGSCARDLTPGAGVILTHLRVVRPPRSDATESVLVAEGEDGEEKLRLLSEALHPSCFTLFSTAFTDVVPEHLLGETKAVPHSHPGRGGWDADVPAVAREDVLNVETCSPPLVTDSVSSVKLSMKEPRMNLTEVVDRMVTGQYTVPSCVITGAIADSVSTLRQSQLLPELVRSLPAAPPQYEPWRRNWFTGLDRGVVSTLMYADNVRMLLHMLGRVEEADLKEASLLDNASFLLQQPIVDDPTGAASTEKKQQKKKKPAGLSSSSSQSQASFVSPRHTRSGVIIAPSEPEEESVSESEEEPAPSRDGPVEFRWGLPEAPVDEAFWNTLDAPKTYSEAMGERIFFPLEYLDDALVGAAVLRASRPIREAVSRALEPHVMAFVDQLATAREAQGGEAPMSSQQSVLPLSLQPVPPGLMDRRRAMHMVREVVMHYAVQYMITAFQCPMGDRMGCLGRRHPRVQGWALMSGLVAPSEGFAPLLPPRSIVPVLDIKQALAVAHRLKPNHEVRFLLQGRPLDIVKSSAVTRRLLESASRVISEHLHDVESLPVEDWDADCVPPSLAMARPVIERAAAEPPQAVEKDVHIDAGIDADVDADVDADAEPPRPVPPPPPVAPAAAEPEAKRVKMDGLARAEEVLTAPTDTLKGILAEQALREEEPLGSVARRSSSVGGAAWVTLNLPKGPSKDKAAFEFTTFGSRVLPMLEEWLGWNSLPHRIRKGESPTAATEAACLEAGLLAGNGEFLDNASLSVAAQAWAHMVTGKPMRTREMVRALASPRTALSKHLINKGWLQAREDFRKNSDVFRLITLVVAIASWCAGSDVWPTDKQAVPRPSLAPVVQPGVEGALAQHRMRALVFELCELAGWSASDRSLVDALRPTSLELIPALDQSSSSSSSSATAVASTVAVAGAQHEEEQSSTDEDLPKSRKRKADKGKNSAAAASAAAPEAAPDVPKQDLVHRVEQRLQLRAEWDSRVLSAHDENMSKSTAAVHQQRLGGPDASALSLIVALEKDSKALDLAHEKLPKGKNKGSKAALERRADTLASMAADGRCLEVVLPLSARHCLFAGSGGVEGDEALGTDADRDLSRAAEVLRVLTRGAEAAEVGGAWSSWQQWLSNPATRLQLCVSMRGGEGLRPAITVLEGVYQAWADDMPPL